MTTNAYSPRSERTRSAPLQNAVGATDKRSMQVRTFGKVRAITTAAACVISFACGSAAHGQASPTAVRSSDLQVGGGFVLAAPDYTEMTFKGYMGYATFDFKPNFGIEFNIHQVNAPSPSKLYERTYELGGRYVRHYGIFHPYAKLMYGRGVFNYEYDVANLAYNLGSAGVGVDVNVQRHINVRADYEYQNWFSYRGFVSQGSVTSNSSSLTPQLFTIGAAYHFQ